MLEHLMMLDILTSSVLALQKLSSGTSNYVCGCGIATAPVSSTRRMLA